MQSVLAKRSKKIIVSIFLLILTLSMVFQSPVSTIAETVTPKDVFDEEFDQYIYDFMEAVEANNTTLALALVNGSEIVLIRSYGPQNQNTTVYQMGKVPDRKSRTGSDRPVVV